MAGGTDEGRQGIREAMRLCPESKLDDMDDVGALANWAQEAWGTYWNWDPKEVWSLGIFIVYAAYLHSRVTVGWSGRKAAVVVLIGFACILINYGVVNVYFVGQHSYSGL